MIVAFLCSSLHLTSLTANPLPPPPHDILSVLYPPFGKLFVDLELFIIVPLGGAKLELPGGCLRLALPFAAATTTAAAAAVVQETHGSSHQPKPTPVCFFVQLVNFEWSYAPALLLPKVGHRRRWGGSSLVTAVWKAARVASQHVGL